MNSMQAARTFTIVIAAMILGACSNAKSAPGSSTPLYSSSLGASADAYGTQQLDGNTLHVWQDKQISFSPVNGATGTYAVAGLPAWASFDATTATITGVPRKAADGGGSITVTKTAAGVTTTYGPYAVELVGDVMKEQQWHLRNVAQNGYALSGGTTGQDVRQTQSITGVNAALGTGVTIAISDSGTVIAHPDLSPNVLAGQSRNYFNDYHVTNSWLGDPTPGYGQDENAHGTAVAGLAAAKGWNGIGGRGVAPEAKFAAFQYIPAQRQLANEGLEDQALHDQFTGDFDVFNYSWGDSQCILTEYPDAYFAKLKYGVANQRANLGSLYVMAGGNDYVADLSDCYANVSSGYVFGNANFTEALTTPYQIAVGAVNADGLSSSYSSPGSALWVSAPGGEFGYSHAVTGSSEASEPALVSTDFLGCGAGLKNIGRGDSAFDAGAAPNTDCAYTSTMNGTSGASPLVTGAIAVMLQVKPALSWRDVKYILATTADRVDPSRTQTSQPGASTQLTGHDYELPWIQNGGGHWFHDWYGFGRINVDAAVAAARMWDTTTLGTFQDLNWPAALDSGPLNLTVPTGAAGRTVSQTVNTSLIIEAVQVRVSVTGCASDVGLELTSPHGTKSYLMNINSGLRDTDIVDHRFLSNAFLDEQVNGAWTLKVVEGKSCAPVLTNWKLNFLGH